MKRNFLLATAMFLTCAALLYAADNIRQPFGKIAYDDVGSELMTLRVKMQVGEDGSASDVSDSSPLPIDFGNVPLIDLFGRLRVSNPETRFDSQLQYDKQPLIWQEFTTGSATVAHLPNESSVLLSVAATLNSEALMQTREYFRYQPGKSQLVFMTTVFGTAAAGVTKQVGYNDSDNGIFFQDIAGALSFVLRSKTSGSVVDTTVAQASWNVDVMDGTGQSGITLDGTKGQIIYINLEWLGTGIVEVGFIIGGKFVPVHRFQNANSRSTAYMTTANLPVRYRIFNTTGANTADMRQVCISVISEGGTENQAAFRFSDNRTTTQISSATRAPLLSIRPKTTFNSIVNRGRIVLESVGALGDKALLVEVVYGGTLTGASFASVNDASIVESDKSATEISGGITVLSFYVGANIGNSITGGVRSILSKAPLFLDKDGAHPTTPFTDIVTVVGISVEGTTATMWANLDWVEIR